MAEAAKTNTAHHMSGAIQTLENHGFLANFHVTEAAHHNFVIGIPDIFFRKILAPEYEPEGRVAFWEKIPEISFIAQTNEVFDPWTKKNKF